jgi:hypothetical protein
MTKRTLGWIGLLAGAVLAWACGIWSPDEGLLAGDAALTRPFETDFAADLIAYHGPAGYPRGSYFTQMHAIDRRQVRMREALLAELHAASAAWPATKRDRLLRPVALHLAARSGEAGGLYQLSVDGPWKILVALHNEAFPAEAVRTLRFSEKDQAERAAAYARAIKQLPAEFRLYFRSLDYGGEDGALLCDELLALPAAERKHLTAVAHFRRARLRLDGLDRTSADDAALRRALAAIRSDLEAVGAAVKAGHPDVGGVVFAAQGWLAHLRCAALPLPRLRALGEADLGLALRIYLEQRRLGEPTADDSIVNLLQAAARYEDFAECARDPELRRLLTAFLSGGAIPDRSEASFDLDGLAGRAGTWLAALREAKVDFSADAVRLAVLAYRVGDWDGCARTLRDAPAKDPLAVLLRARLALRAGRPVEASRTLEALLAPQAGRFTLGDYFVGEFVGDQNAQRFVGADGDRLFAYRFAASDPVAAQLAKARSELATLLLAQGRYREALDHFYRTGQLKDFAYIAECVLTIEELKAYVDREWPEDPPVGKPKVQRPAAKPDEEPAECSPFPPAQEIRHLLARRLFRAGRADEALPYYPAEVRPAFAHYLELLSRATNPARAKRDRADAYWRAALVLRELGDTTQFCEFGPDWSSGFDYSDDGTDRKPLHWHDAGGLPRTRIQPIGEEAESLLAPPGPDEQARVQTWIAANLVRPDRAHRSARYAVARLARQAADLLPDDDVAGSRILHYAGGLLKYMEPEAAQPYYRQLATRFKGTELGAAARRAHWFTAWACEPDPDWIQKGR